MANLQNSTLQPLYEKFWYKHSFKRVADSFILVLLLLLLGSRVISLVNNYSFTWFVAFICESWFTMSWIFTFTAQWSPAVTKTYPDRLSQRIQDQELPPVDLFVTTADPELEPPIITVNTVLSLLALNYPTNKLACYVSDDGCSPLTFYALQEASKFAKLWIPFCKKYNLQIRAPFKYFCEDPDQACTANNEPQQFKQEWLRLKDMYDHLNRKIEDMATTSIPSQLHKELSVFSNTERKNHAPIIKVVWENKEGLSDGVPHLIYVSREKRPKHPHHFKAGAMNVLTRVSGLITNAPFTLNVDCDMFVNNPNIILHAMCILLDSIGEKEVAFVQCPQQFYGGLKDDPFGNQMVVLFKYVMDGIAGLQGPFYIGTNCFHRRKVVYGLSPDNIENGKTLLSEELIQKFGASKELVNSAAHALEGRTYSQNDINVSQAIEAATQVASCGYEYGTGWGDQVGWMYGALAEDLLTGINIHTKGWRSEMATPNPIPFTGCAPVGLPNLMIQQKRWATGLLECFINKNCPIFGTLYGNLRLRQLLGYMWIINWGIEPIFETCYVCVLTYCLITNTSFLPKGQSLWIPVTLLVVYMVTSLSEYWVTGLSMRAWWNYQRMSRIIAMNPGFCGILNVLFKLMRISNTVFDITKKDQPLSDDVRDDPDAGRFTFDDSIIFVPGTTILLLQLTAMIMKLLRLQPSATTPGVNECGPGEMFCSLYLVICYWPFLKGLFEREKYGIPISTICKSVALAFLFVCLCRKTSES